MNESILKLRFIQDTVPVRLGNIAVHLNRINSWLENPDNGNLLYSMIKETRLFIEWTTPDMEAEQATQLNHLERYLARCLSDWDKIWNDAEQKNKLSEEVSNWSEKVLQISGLEVS